MFCAAAGLGVAIRLYISGRGYNFDTEMLFKIAELPPGANFYREFHYAANWGPIPYNVFQVFFRLAGADGIDRFHTLLAAFFTACDLVSAFVLWRVWGLGAAVWFLLFSPVAIVLAGYHCNAEPAVVAAALAGYYWHVRSGGSDTGSVHPVFLVFLGISLSFKHAFILFPLWLAMRPMSWRVRVASLVVPYAVWLLVALYYLVPEPGHFFKNVLGYSGWSGNALVPMVVSAALRALGATDANTVTLRPLWMPLFLGGMLGVGWWIRTWSLERTFLLYPLAMLATANAVALQYFNLASYSIAASVDVIGVAFSAFTAYFYAGDPEELHLLTLPAWLSRAEGSLPYAFNWGWIICQAILAALLMRRLWVWRLSERARTA